MISKSQLKKIIFIQKNIFDKEFFLNDLFKTLNLYLNQKITKEKFNGWLDSWEATAELDMDPDASRRILKSYKEIKAKKTPHKSWEEFKRSINPS